MYFALIAAALLAEPSPAEIESYLQACVAGEFDALEKLKDQKKLLSRKLPRAKPKTRKEQLDQLKAEKQRAADLKAVEKAIATETERPSPPVPRLAFPPKPGAIGKLPDGEQHGRVASRIDDGLYDVQLPAGSGYLAMKSDGSFKFRAGSVGPRVVIASQKALVIGERVELNGLWRCVRTVELEIGDVGVLQPADSAPYDAWFAANEKEARRRIAELRAAK